MGLLVLAALVCTCAGLVSVRAGDATYVDDCMNFNRVPTEPQPRIIHFVESAQEVSQIVRGLGPVRFSLSLFFRLPFSAPVGFLRFLLTLCSLSS
jgi:hypothetical protein